VVQQPLEHPAAMAQHTVHAAPERQAKRTGRPYLDAQLDGFAQRFLPEPPSR
jgi:hypothetical protein